MRGPSKQLDDIETQQRCKLLDERLKAIEGVDTYGRLDIIKLSLVPDLVIPPKFRVLDFLKYYETICPLMHLKMFCRKMGGYTNNEKIMIHCFHDSLSEFAARWYAQLNRYHIQSWEDLAKAFLYQYKHVRDTAPDRLSLQILEMKERESFKEYAQRWWDMAS